jgi:hypothetical protein
MDIKGMHQFVMLKKATPIFRPTKGMQTLNDVLEAVWGS